MAARSTIGVRLDDKLFRTFLAGYERQIPYALSLAINATARDGVTVVRAHLPEDFTIRHPWVERGLRYKAGNKRNLTAQVYTVDAFMRLQAEGGTAHGAVPMTGAKRPRTRATRTTPRSKWPKALLSKRSAFVGAPFGRTTPGVWERIKIRRGKKGRKGLRLLYLLPQKIDIPARWPLRERVEGVVAVRWQDHAMSAIREALDTAYPPR